MRCHGTRAKVGSGIVTPSGAPKRHLRSRLAGRSVRVGDVPETVAGHLEGGRLGCRGCSREGH